MPPGEGLDLQDATPPGPPAPHKSAHSLEPSPLAMHWSLFQGRGYLRDDFW